MTKPKIAIINVGANAASGPFKSPIFEDRTFEFVPIKARNPETTVGFDTFAEFKSFNGRPIDFIKKKYLSESMHNDPEFVTHTYGDKPNKPRAFNLRWLNKGDTLYYLARLVKWDKGTWRKAGFYLIGKLVLDKVIEKSELEMNPKLIPTVQNNSHVKRWKIKPEAEPSNFFVLVGSDKSKRFVHAVPFDRNIVQKILLDSDDKPIKWDSSENDLRTIGSHTRSCRLIVDPARIEILEKHIRDFCKIN